MPGCKTCVHEPIRKCSWPGRDCPDWGPKREAYDDLLAACFAARDALDDGCRDCPLTDVAEEECPEKHCLALSAAAALLGAIGKARGEEVPSE